MGGICGSFGSSAQLESIAKKIRENDERELYVKNPGVALIGNRGRCFGDGFFYGNIYSDEEIDACYEGTIDDIAKSFAAIARKADGEFIITAFHSDKLCISRDYFGKMPLFFQKKPVFQFSTSQKGFEKSKNVARVPEGSSVVVKNGKITKRHIRPKLKFKKKRLDFFTAMPLIQKELGAAIERRAQHHKKLTIMFSGGLDSTLLAKIGMKYADISLVTIGSECAEDRINAEKLEDLFGLKLDIIELDPEVVEKHARTVIDAIGSRSVLDFEIALPSYLAALHTKADLLISGQGADELFGGYFRYNEAYKKSPEEFEKIQLYDIINLSEKNLERDQLAVKAGGSHLSTPYLTPELASIALSTETMTKINVLHNKIVLRKIAEKNCLPMEICIRNKKAMQYGCGIHTILQKMAKERSYTKEKAKEEGYTGPLEMIVNSF